MRFANVYIINFVNISHIFHNDVPNILDAREGYVQFRCVHSTSHHLALARCWPLVQFFLITCVAVKFIMLLVQCQSHWNVVEDILFNITFFIWRPLLTSRNYHFQAYFPVSGTFVLSMNCNKVTNSLWHWNDS